MVAAEEDGLEAEDEEEEVDEEVVDTVATGGAVVVEETLGGRRLSPDLFTLTKSETLPGWDRSTRLFLFS